LFFAEPKNCKISSNEYGEKLPRDGFLGVEMAASHQKISSLKRDEGRRYERPIKGL
jgi:hypothetical protein